MDARDEEDLTIQIPPHDGSQTERSRGTFGGRQRWISGSTDGAKGVGAPPSGVDSKSSGANASLLLSPRGGGGKGIVKSKVTAPSVQPFLSSMGILVGEETHIVDKEVNEVAVLRREYDTAKNINWRKEQDIKRLEEEVENMTMTLNGRVSDGAQAKAKAGNVENKSALYESKLEEELADRGVYAHMITRLTHEALAAKKATLVREQQLEALDHELASSMAALLSARQDKSSAELAYRALYTEWWERKQANVRALADMEQAVAQTKLQYGILEQREVARKQHVAEALGELKQQATRRLRHESSAQMTHFSELQDELSDTDWRLLAVEAEFKQIVEAAGTSDVEQIIRKFVARDETHRALQDEHALADAKMRKLRARHKELHETLSALRGAAVNSRTIYQAMDETAERLKDIEKDAVTLADKCNRANVAIDAFRACMLKCLRKLRSVQGTLDNDNDDAYELSRALETPTPELVHVVEQKLNRVLDVINREKAERELHRSEASLGGPQDGSGGSSGTSGSVIATVDKHSSGSGSSGRAPALHESEEHFILRMSSANTSAANVRVRPKSRAGGAAASRVSATAMDEPKHAAAAAAARRLHGTGTGTDAIAHNHHHHQHHQQHDGGDDDDSEHSGGGAAVSAATVASAAATTSMASACSNGAVDDPVIDRYMRKKLVGLIVNRGKRGKKPTTQQQH